MVVPAPRVSARGEGQERFTVHAHERLGDHRGRFAAAGSLSRSDGYQDGVGRDTNFLTLVGDHSFSPRLNVHVNVLVSDVDATRGSIVPLDVIFITIPPFLSFGCVTLLTIAIRPHSPRPATYATSPRHLFFGYFITHWENGYSVFTGISIKGTGQFLTRFIW